jgi:hypothetical protein
MNDAVVVTEWYVVPEEAGASRSTQGARSESAARLVAASAGPLWAWAGGASSAPRWHRARQMSASGGGYLFALPHAGRASAPASATDKPPAVLPMAPGVLRAMSLAAQAKGCPESEIWAEAAREWLMRHLGDDPEPPTPGASAPVRRVERESRLRCWSAIDVLLRDLRAPLPSTTEDEPAA